LPCKQFQNSNHLGDLRLTYDRHLVIRSFQALEVDVRLPSQRLANKAKSVRSRRSGGHLSREQRTQILVVANYRHRDVGEPHVASIDLTAACDAASSL